MQPTKRVYFTMDDCEIDLNGLIDQVESAKKLTELIKTRYKYNWVVFQDFTTDTDVEQPNSLKVDDWKNRFKTIYEVTKEKYQTIIKLYQDNESKLLDKIKTTNVSRFNDTPQASGGSYDALEYATTIAVATSEQDGGELVDRLDAIHNKLHNLYGEWLAKFSSLFGLSTL